MPAFRVSGATGQAPTTIFFGAIPDKFNFMLPAHMQTPTIVDVLATCNFVNQMTVWNQSFGGGPNVATGTFGAFTTAPDGTTNTAQLFVEATSNSVHLLQSCTPNVLTANTSTGIGVREFGTLTFSGFFKYSGRRITMMISGNTGNASGNGDPNPHGGVQATFDLLNGVIGVAPALFGEAVGQYSSPSAEITGSFGNGWYRCSITAVVNHAFTTDMGSLVFGSVFLDNGTGNAAASTSYNGDGVSGVYGWRINMMPRDAYAMSGQSIFFDDFLSSSTIDLGNTLAPGFNWYLQHSTVFRLAAPNTPFAPTSPSILTVSGSILSIAPSGSGTSELDSCAATSTVLNSSTVGTTYTIPALFETRMNWDYNLSNGSSANPSFWAESMPFLVGQPFSFNTNPTQANLSLPGKECDFMEGITLGGGLFPGNTYFIYDPATERNGNECSKNNNAYGFAKWQQFLTYNTGNFGVFYTVDSNYYLVLAPSLNQPPGTPGKWTAYSPPPAPVTVTYEDFHVYSVMYFPWKRGSFGLILTWLDSVPVGISSYAPVNNVGAINHGVFGNTTGHVADGQPMRINIQGCGSTCTTRYDWVRVTN